MSGEEVRELLISSGFILKDIAETIGISPQALDSRLRAKNVSVSTLNEISLAIDKPNFFKNIPSNETPEIGNFNSLFEIMKKQADSLERKDQQIDRLITLLENQLNKKI